MVDLWRQYTLYERLFVHACSTGELYKALLIAIFLLFIFSLPPVAREVMWAVRKKGCIDLICRLHGEQVADPSVA